MAYQGIRVTVTDIETGESETQEIKDDYLVITTGNRYIANTNWYPTKGTTVLTIKVDRGEETT